MRLFNTRISPRPTDTVAGVTAAGPTIRRKVAAGSDSCRIHGGSIQRTTAGGGTEAEVVLSFYRSSGSDPCDFVDSQTITLEALGDPGEAQASFAFDPPLDVTSPHQGFWWTVQNAASTSEDYAVAFDVEACTETSVGSG